jgi:phosphoglycerate dehydrogenase-like enzyme
MDVLIVEPLEPEVLQWIDARHPVRFAPQLERDPRGLRQALFNVRALIVPPSVALDAQALQFAPVLRAVGRLSAGAENLDAEALARAGVEIVRPGTAGAGAEAEFAIGAMLQLLRRVPVRSNDGMLVGRELAGATVGLVGMPAAARPLADLLGAFGALVKGYDPALHVSDGLWQRWKIAPVGLRELIEQSDVVCVLLNYFSRYKGLLGERFLPHCKADQVLVSLGHSDLFDEAALAEAPGSTAWSRGCSTRSGRCTRCATCRSRRVWPAPRASHASAVRGRWCGASTKFSATRRRAPNSGRRSKTIRLISKTFQRLPKVLEPLLLLTDHRRRRTRHEAGVVQLDGGLADLGFDARHFLGQARALGLDVDAHQQRQPGRALHRHGR